MVKTWWATFILPPLLDGAESTHKESPGDSAKVDNILAFLESDVPYTLGLMVTIAKSRPDKSQSDQSLYLT